jgi:glycosyltransferase involved in cell wall biosynthesis
MRVLLDTTAALLAPGGTAVYVERLAAALEDAGVEVLRHCSPRRRPPGTGSVRNALEDLRWSQIGLRRAARAADVVHHPLPALTIAGPRPQVVTVHDLAFEALPGRFDARFRHYARLVHRLAVRRADAVVVPSRATADELERRWGVRDAVVVPHGPGQELAVRRGEPRHLLYVGDAEPRKDVPTLLAAYARYRSAVAAPLPLVLAGRGHAHVRAPGVTVVDAPGPDALAGLYAHAAALVHPSLHEGFGLTVLEALTAGTPVIAADVPAVREVAGDRARYVPPGDASALAAALADPPPALPPAGTSGAAEARHTWERSARGHIAAYERAISRSRR